MSFKPRRRFSDETFVWFTSMGLAVGVAMVVFLLGLITMNGSKVFWPKKIAVMHLAEAGGGQSLLGGEIMKRQQKPVKRPDGSRLWEYQLYTANKDVYGLAFKYVDEHQVKKITYPDGLLSIERMEYGDAIGYPKALQLESGRLVPVEAPSFDDELRTLVREAAARRAEIRSIEKGKIGEINRRMEALRLKEKSLKSKNASTASLEKEREDLQARYEVLAEKARVLRRRQSDNKLLYTLVSGQEKSLPIGQVAAYHYANRLGFFERLGIAFHGFWTFLMDEPREANTEGGIFPAIFGTFVMTLLMSLAVTPFGVLAAIYLREYAKQGFLVRCVRIAVNNLAGVPSIVFGVFGLGFFVYFVGGSLDRLFFREALPTPTFGTGGILWAALTLALMTVPVVIVATEEALASVSRGTREGSLACGASKWQTIQRVVLPASAPGILTGLILAMARGAGEVAPLMLVGVVKLAPSMPLDMTFPFFHLDRKFMHLGFHIYDLGFQSPDSEAAKPMVFATTFLLIMLVIVLNLSAIIIRERLRKKYAVGAF